jgi:hypothetical protein
MQPEEMKQAIAKILIAENKAKELLNIFGSTKNMQLILIEHVELFVDEIVQLTKEVFKPIITDRGELPGREVMAKLLDNSLDALIEYNAVSGYYQNDKAQAYIDWITKIQMNYQTAANYLRHSISCFLMGLTNAGKNLLKLSILEVINSEKFLGSINQQAIESEGAKKRSKVANKKRHAKTNLIKAYALKLYDEGDFPSVRNAAQQLAPIIMDYAENDEELKAMEGTDKKFNCIFQAADTIERWIGKSNRAKK